MSLKFKPYTDEELVTRLLLQEDDYFFEIISASEKVSASGNNIILIKLKVQDVNNHTHIVFDYLLSTESMLHKVKKFCEAVGLEEKYYLGELSDEDCLNKTGKARIAIKPQSTGPDGKIYLAKNFVKYYITSQKNSESIGSAPLKFSPTHQPQELNDDLPF